MSGSGGRDTGSQHREGVVVLFPEKAIGMNQPGHVPSPGYGELPPDPPPCHVVVHQRGRHLRDCGCRPLRMAHGPGKALEAPRDHPDRPDRHHLGGFGSGFPVLLAINAHIPTWPQSAIGCLTVPLSLIWCRAPADLVCTEKSAPWTFWGLFKSRFMTPNQRERYINSIGWDSTYRPRPADLAAQPLA